MSKHRNHLKQRSFSLKGKYFSDKQEAVLATVAVKYGHILIINNVSLYTTKYQTQTHTHTQHAHIYTHMQTNLHMHIILFAADRSFFLNNYKSCEKFVNKLSIQIFYCLSFSFTFSEYG